MMTQQHLIQGLHLKLAAVTGDVSEAEAVKVPDLPGGTKNHAEVRQGAYGQSREAL